MSMNMIMYKLPPEDLESIFPTASEFLFSKSHSSPSKSESSSELDSCS